uniref:Uncharacterized protein n=1 Tax=Glossina palpalis gambiensis TaxID=67801 RepID=A0A1B0AX76_9MUSC
MLKLIYGLLMAALKSVDLNTKLIALAPVACFRPINGGLNQEMLRHNIIASHGKRVLVVAKGADLEITDTKDIKRIHTVASKCAKA